MSQGGWKRRWVVGGVAATLALLSSALGACGSTPEAHVVAQVTPGTTLFDQPVKITVTGLEAHQSVTLHMSAPDLYGFIWESQATVRANDAGAIDEGITPGQELLARLQPASASNTDSYFTWEPGLMPFSLKVMLGQKLLTSASFERQEYAPGVTNDDESIAATGFYGDFWAPPRHTARHAAVLEFGGSEGGLSGGLEGAALASAGYPTLDLAYFGEIGLPSTLSRIPLSYFATALRWLARQPGVAPHQIWVMGTSRGGEAALLLGAHYPQLVHGIIDNTGADVSECAYPGCGGPAWTYEGKALPYAPLDSEPSVFLPVPQIKAPVLLDCGTADLVWDSCGMAAVNLRRLNRDPSPHILYRFVGAGHGVNADVPFEPFTAAYTADHEGGGVDLVANTYADAILWPRLLAFLAHPSGSGTPSYNVGP